MPISIHYPHARGVRVGPKFVASGLTISPSNDLPLIGVVGKLTTSGGGRPTFARTVLFRSRRGMGGRQHCWAILFTDVPPDTYTLEVAGVHADGALTRGRTVPNIVVRAAADGSPEKGEKAANVNPVEMMAIGVAHPANDSSLTAEEKDYFVAWGTTTDNTILATSASLGTVPADSADGSPPDQIWWAAFPVLTTSGSFGFIVKDATNTHIGNSSNVTVP